MGMTLCNLIIPILVVLILCCALFPVWGLHWFPYSSAEDRKKGKTVRESRDYSTRELFCKSHSIYSRKDGLPLKDRKTGIPLKMNICNGIRKTLLVAILFIVGSYFLTIGLSLAYSTNWWYVFFLCIFVLTCGILLPDTFVKYAQLTGRVTEFPNDFPWTASYWGLIMSIYGTLAILIKDGIWTYHTVNQIIAKLVPFKVIQEWGLRGFPWFAVGLIMSATLIMFSDRLPPFPTWVCLFFSCLIGALTAYLLSFCIY